VRIVTAPGRTCVPRRAADLAMIRAYIVDDERLAVRRLTSCSKTPGG
jgi:hypothetical protein